MRVAVTGAAGFVGSEVVQCHLAAGDSVRALSRRPLDVPLAQVALGDLRDEAYVYESLRGVDVVQHIAARVGAVGSMADFIEDNVRVTETVLRAAAAGGVRRVVLCSSPSVVFAGESIRAGDESLPLSPSPRSAYSVSKARAEQVATELGEELGLHLVILRPHLVWGPGDRHLLPDLLRLGRLGFLPRPGSHDPLVDPTHVTDVAAAHLLAAAYTEEVAKGTIRTFFITGGAPVPVWSTIAELIEAASGRRLRPRTVPVPVVVGASWVADGLNWASRGRITSPLSRFAIHSILCDQWFSIDLARRELGYSPRMDLARGLEELRATRR